MTSNAQTVVFTSLFLNLFICLLLVIYQWHQNKGVIYLLIVILGINLRQVTMLLLNQSRNTYELAVLLVHMDPFVYLIGPMFYYYIRSLVKGKIVMDRYLILLLIPFPLLLINIFPYFLYPFDVKLKFAELLQQKLFFRVYPNTYIKLSVWWLCNSIPLSKKKCARI
jgi:hypothetical protein